MKKRHDQFPCPVAKDPASIVAGLLKLLQQPEEQITGLPHQVAPMQLPGKGGAGHDNPDAKRAVTRSNDDAELGRGKKRQANGCDE